ncbi:MAG: hypothetical protein ACE5G8_14305, partial [Anaerolineae bacterium]
MTKSLPSTRHSLLISLLLAITLLAGGALRFYNLRWDLGTFPHPDERSTLLFYAPTIRPPQTGVSWLDPRRSPLNPFWNVQTQERRSYTYGHFPLYLLVATGDWLAQLAPTLQTLHAPPGVVDWFSRAETGMGYAVVGRGLVALFDTLSLYLIFLIARRMYGP